LSTFNTWGPPNSVTLTARITEFTTDRTDMLWYINKIKTFICFLSLWECPKMLLSFLFLFPDIYLNFGNFMGRRVRPPPLKSVTDIQYNTYRFVYHLIICFFPVENFSFTCSNISTFTIHKFQVLHSRHHCRWKATNFDLCFYVPTPDMTRSLRI
jgi:hypothetical protein